MLGIHFYIFASCELLSNLEGMSYFYYHHAMDWIRSIVSSM